MKLSLCKKSFAMQCLSNHSGNPKGVYGETQACTESVTGCAVSVCALSLNSLFCSFAEREILCFFSVRSVCPGCKQAIWNKWLLLESVLRVTNMHASTEGSRRISSRVTGWRKP